MIYHLSELEVSKLKGEIELDEAYCCTLNSLDLSHNQLGDELIYPHESSHRLITVADSVHYNVSNYLVVL